MLEKVYPEELRHLAPPPTPDRAQIVRWISRKTQTGDGASNQMAAFYLLLANGDPKDPDTGENDEPSKARAKPAPTTGRRAARPAPLAAKPAAAMDAEVHLAKQRTPAMHIDVQVHISPQASPEQIDAIFASMARHLYRD